MLIEDAAQAIGARSDVDGARPARSARSAASRSSRRRSCASGRAARSPPRRSELAARVRSLRSHAMTTRHLGPPPRLRAELRRRSTWASTTASTSRAPRSAISRLGRLPRGHRGPARARLQLPPAPGGPGWARAGLERRRRRALLALRLSGAAGRSRRPRRLPRALDRAGDPDDLVPGAAPLHGVPRAARRAVAAGRRGGGRPPLRTADVGHFDADDVDAVVAAVTRALSAG